MFKTITGNENSGFTASAEVKIPAAEPVKAIGSADREETEDGVVVEITENLLEMYRQQAEAAKKAAKKAAEGAEELAKILEIARRISRGDKVPASDEQKLAEYDAGLYQMAKSSALLHADKKHKRYDALFEEENEEGIDARLRDLKRQNSGTDSVEGEQNLSQK